MNPNPNPLLVEATIKSIMNSQLNDCKKDKFLRNSMFLNIFLFIIFSVVVSVILFIQYKGKQNIEQQIIKDNKKRNYILSKLQVLQKMKESQITNIPIY
jgi:Na+-transporting NADH:ubiquinone oxidoreductase subunit NqrC